VLARFEAYLLYAGDRIGSPLHVSITCARTEILSQ